MRVPKISFGRTVSIQAKTPKQTKIIQENLESDSENITFSKRDNRFGIAGSDRVIAKQMKVLKELNLIDSKDMWRFYQGRNEFKTK